jgi:hypothetical protein
MNESPAALVSVQLEMALECVSVGDSGYDAVSNMFRMWCGLAA